MKVRELIYELIQMEMEDEVRIYDADTKALYETRDIETERGFIDLIIRSEE